MSIQTLNRIAKLVFLLNIMTNPVVSIKQMNSMTDCFQGSLDCSMDADGIVFENGGKEVIMTSGNERDSCLEILRLDGDPEEMTCEKKGRQVSCKNCLRFKYYKVLMATHKKKNGSFFKFSQESYHVICNFSVLHFCLFYCGILFVVNSIFVILLHRKWAINSIVIGSMNLVSNFTITMLLFFSCS